VPVRGTIHGRDVDLDEEQADLHPGHQRGASLRLLRFPWPGEAQAQGGLVAVRAYWILPNRDQGDETLASDGKTILPLRQILDPTLRPEGFSHGVPTELLEKCGPKASGNILFAQRFTGWNG